MNFLPQTIFGVLATSVVGTFGYFATGTPPAPTPVALPVVTEVVQEVVVPDPVGTPPPPELEAYLKSGAKPSVSPSKSVAKPTEKKKKKGGKKEESDAMFLWRLEQDLAEVRRPSPNIRTYYPSAPIKKPEPLKVIPWKPPVMCAQTKSGEKFAPRCK